MKLSKCLRCGHTWYQRTPSKPRICPKCKSPYWDKPRKNKSDASHYAKVAAGKKAMDLIEDGGDLSEAESILNNWLPKEAIWD